MREERNCVLQSVCQSNVLINFVPVQFVLVVEIEADSEVVQELKSSG